MGTRSPAVVRIVWPPTPTVVDPRRFPDVAATIARLFAEAATTLAAIKAMKRGIAMAFLSGPPEGAWVALNSRVTIEGLHSRLRREIP